MVGGRLVDSESRGLSPSPDRSRKTSPASHPAFIQCLDLGVQGFWALNITSGAGNVAH